MMQNGMPSKPGQKTSEFVFSAAIVGIIVFSDQLGVTLDDRELASLVAIAVTYTGGRSLIKTLLPYLKDSTYAANFKENVTNNTTNASRNDQTRR